MGKIVDFEKEYIKRMLFKAKGMDKVEAIKRLYLCMRLLNKKMREEYI